MDWRRSLKILFGVLVVLSFLGALLGILVTGPVVVPQRKLELDVNPSAARLQADVERLCSDFGTRSYRQPQDLLAASDWIRAELEAAGLRVELQDYELDDGVFRNVIGFRPGATPDAPAVVIGAHYDAYGGFPGADDNASGVAVLLELARTLPDATPRFGQYFVAFSTEEPPFFGTEDMGSYRFAGKLAADGVDVDLMIALDMVGFFSDDPGSQTVPLSVLGLLYPREGNFVAVTADLANGVAIRRVKQGIKAMREIEVHSFRAPGGYAGVDQSDHLSFWRHGFPAVLVTDTSFHRNPHYHRAEDTPDTLDYDAMVRVTRSLHGVLWNNGGAPAPEALP
ncbi:MAG: M28 family peptidase [Acidobacteria bacterium]|nr:M28 family peptidase [Acidobacteriota bacterium]NIM62211.1 M28 family peptidase [Acidobacteriota bacterium]NIO58993.1 M28 family peptidase [Acidobacteriota bacterium]NIQ30039.1 M28 family peptidase [Acidobacteriota bacterium]NIQ84805.1 M28 family peptidase [Acidobacteriota bacterium]